MEMMFPIWIIILILVLFNDDIKCKTQEIQDELQLISDSEINTFEPEYNLVRNDSKKGVEMGALEGQHNSSRKNNASSIEMDKIKLSFSMNHFKQMINQKRGNLTVLNSLIYNVTLKIFKTIRTMQNKSQNSKFDRKLERKFV
jgi:hypothetical protein